MNQPGQILQDALNFHGHPCRTSVAVVRESGLPRSGGLQIPTLTGNGGDHGGMCFGDGVQTEPDAIPEAEQMELVDLVRKAEPDTLTLGGIFHFDAGWMPEITGFGTCDACHEFTARACGRPAGDKHVRISCSGYER